MAATNAFKTPYTRSLNLFAQRKILDEINTHGRALPCKVTAVSGSIVTVSFQVTSDFTLPKVTIPVIGPEYIRFPIQVGCKGITLPADVSLGNITGMGTGDTPNIDDLPATLSALVFVPIATTSFSDTDDANKVVIYGPDGVIIRDSTGASKIDVSTTGTSITGAKIGMTGITSVTGTFSVSGMTTLGTGTPRKVGLTGDSVIGGTLVATSTQVTAV